MKEHKEHTQGEAEAPAPQGMADIEGRAPLINLNSATERELRQLPGIGEVLAARIVGYRTEAGPFQEPSQITAVPGISDEMYARIADLVTLAPAEPTPAPLPEPVLSEAEEPIPSRVEEPILSETEGPLPEGFEPEAIETEEVLPAPEPEPPPEPEPEPEPAWEPLPEPPPLIEVPPKRGVGCWQLLLAGLLSLIAGALLSLLVLWIVNGTLDFRGAATRALRAEAFRLDGEIQELNAGLEQLRHRLAAMEDLAAQVAEAQVDIRNLQDGLGALQGKVDLMGEELAAAQTALSTLRDDMAGMAKDVAALAETTDALTVRVGAVEEQLDAVNQELDVLREATRRFNAFLTGLRQLLDQTQGQIPEATPTFHTPPPAMPVSPTPEPSAPTSPPTVAPGPMITVIPLASPTPTLAP